jgi:hypothetical protein
MASTLPTTETTALAAPNTPTRRSSWKTNTDFYNAHCFTDEKNPHAFAASSNPFSPTYTSLHLPVPILPPSPPVTHSDIEAQPFAFVPAPPQKRTRLRICAIIVCVLLLWGALSYGVVVYFGPYLPGANKLRELREEMVDMEAAVKLVREQVGGLVGYMEGLREWIGEWEGDGHEGHGVGFEGEDVHANVHGHGHETVGGW